MTDIETLAVRSETPQHELILQMLTHYGVDGVRDLTDEQIEYFAKHHGDADVKIYQPKKKDGVEMNDAENRKITYEQFAEHFANSVKTGLLTGDDVVNMYAAYCDDSQDGERE